jgi:hypothetical protein
MNDQIIGWTNDLWIERRYSWLHDEHHRLGGGVIGQHYLKCIGAQYSRFLFTGQQHDRYRTWLGIRTLSQWLVQLRGGLP